MLSSLLLNLLIRFKGIDFLLAVLIREENIEHAYKVLGHKYYSRLHIHVIDSSSVKNGEYIGEIPEHPF